MGLSKRTVNLFTDACVIRRRYANWICDRKHQMFNISDTKMSSLRMIVSLSPDMYPTYTAPYHFGLKKDSFPIEPPPPRVFYVFIHICMTNWSNPPKFHYHKRQLVGTRYMSEQNNWSWNVRLQFDSRKNLFSSLQSRGYIFLGKTCAAIQ
jgi:hypothetical protein